MSRRSRCCALAVLCVLQFATVTHACSVPVFRYALERWRSDPYQAVLFYRGSLDESSQAVAKTLSREGRAGEIFANVQVRTVDVDKIDADQPKGKADALLWKNLGTEEVPQLAVYYPLSNPIPKPIWKGQPTAESATQLLQSGQRREIARRILKGDTAVFLMVEGPDEKQNAVALATVEAALRKAEASLKLPPADPQDVADGLITVDQDSLKIRFSTMVLKRDDPNEAHLINMLMNSEEDLKDDSFKDEPMVFPLFGRGRALYAIIGKGIDEDNVMRSCEELIGPCTCQVKDQNPGTDLLMAVDWESMIETQIEVDTALPPLPTLTSFKQADAESAEKPVESKASSATEREASTATEETADAAPTASASVIKTTMLFVGIGVMGVIVVSVFLVKV